MSYNVSVTIDCVKIRRHHFARLLQLLSEARRNSGAYAPGDAPDDFADLRDAFEWWNHSISINDQELLVEYFEGDSWIDDEFYEVIAPFVVHEACPGMVTVVGEDGASWRYIFENGRLRLQNGVITYQDV
jgi:hypothetical protein